MVSDILHRKGNAIWSVHPDSTVYDALQLMAEKDVGALLIIENDRLVGIFSERDYARKIILQGRSSLSTTVREIMSDNVITIHPEQHLEECMAVMTMHHIRHLPVMNGSTLAGVISIGDVVKEIIADQSLEIEQLENYITGRSYSADPLQH
jgi:CBS domain-containing protein